MELMKRIFWGLIFSVGLAACASKPVPDDASMTPKERKSANFELLKSHRAEIDHCVRIAWDERAENGLQTAVFVWEIEPDGRVADVTFNEKKTTLKDSELIACLKSASKAWSFIKSDTAETSKISLIYNLR